MDMDEDDDEEDEEDMATGDAEPEMPEDASAAEVPAGVQVRPGYNPRSSKSCASVCTHVLVFILPLMFIEGMS